MSETSLEKLAKEFTEFKSKKKSKHYPEQLKQQALKLAKDGVPIKQLCEELGVHVTTFCYWRRAAQNIKPFTKANIVESNGADVAMFYYTVIETCKLLGLNPRAYLSDQSHRHWRGLELQNPLVWAQA